MFATDGQYTAFASVALGQFEPIKDHLRALRDASRKVNGDSGKVIHEVITDGSVYFGTIEDPGNTDETAKFPSAVALVWRWTGDQRFLDEMYDFTKANMRYLFASLDKDRDLWPEGLGAEVERRDMGEEEVDNAVYTIRDLAALARATRDNGAELWAESRAGAMHARFDRTWWMPKVPQHADSLGQPDNRKIQQRHCIGVTPMEVEWQQRGDAVLGVTRPQYAAAALNLRETSCYGDAFGLFLTGTPGCDPGRSTIPARRTTFTVWTSVMAVAEGNYGRLGLHQQQRFNAANRRLHRKNSRAPCRSSPPLPTTAARSTFLCMSAPWCFRPGGAYGPVWSVVHQQLGVRPDLGITASR